MRSRTSALATATARLGYAIQPQVLVYVKGGGVEFLIAPNWSVFAEYNYLDFGSKTLTLQGYSNTASATASIQVTHRIDTAMFGVNYRFGLP